MPDTPLSADFDATLPTELPVAVIVASRPAANRWVDEVHEVIGVTVSRPEYTGPTVINERDGLRQWLYPGLAIRLYADECESYYYNLVSNEPRCFVVAHRDDDGCPPEPFLATLSYDEAAAYQEGEDDVYAVPIPPELYPWLERFVLANYVPEKRTKRKRRDWKAEAQQ